MKKAIFEKYGDLDVIQIIDAPMPVAAKNEVIVKVKSVGLNPKDILVRKGKFKRLSGKKFPQTIAYECSGIIEDPNGSHFQKGDKVFGMVNGMKGRCCAEYVRISLNEIAKAPSNLSYHESAGIPLAAQTALQAIRDLGKLQKGQSICINGASGGVGTLAIQIAKELGGQITTISSQKNTDFCRSLGANQAIAYDGTDILKSDQKFDVFFDVFGNYSFKKTAHLLESRGIYISTVPKMEIIKEQFFNLFRRKKAKLVVVKSNRKDLQWLAQGLEKGIIKPIVDKVFPMEAIQEAQKYIATKRAKGKVIIQMD
ncbi:MAG: NAD(P)-dependent alcohol dehydrogenase [Saprospiraceae bacterium]|nr:NAD(P)-dependent alcohol dehydrogenase [Saprospiraceae bacterium]